MKEKRVYDTGEEFLNKKKEKLYTREEVDALMELKNNDFIEAIKRFKMRINKYDFIDGEDVLKWIKKDFGVIK